MTEEQAREAIKIINEECAASIDERDAYGFIRYVTNDDHDYKEWRFMGSLGFGGKFRVNSGRPHPYVDCYREDETPSRLDAIKRANTRLEMICV
jgi:hypothetical protein